MEYVFGTEEVCSKQWTVHCLAQMLSDVSYLQLEQPLRLETTGPGREDGWWQIWRFFRCGRRPDLLRRKAVIAQTSQ